MYRRLRKVAKDDAAAVRSNFDVKIFSKNAAVKYNYIDNLTITIWPPNIYSQNGGGLCGWMGFNKAQDFPHSRLEFENAVKHLSVAVTVTSHVKLRKK